MNLFDPEYEKFHFEKGKTINVVECFSGIGTQAMALKKIGQELGIKFNFMAISEIDKFAIQSYNAIHGETHNLGAIGNFERFPEGIDICTWSFPCQDISVAGNQEGMQDGTRSNYGYEFLDTVKRTPYNERPKVLLMENVPALISEKFRDDYNEIYHRLEQLGYTNWSGLMNAKEYGVPQNRKRVFIISILGKYSYSFPKAFKLETSLKDYLETVVDEKYFLSQKLIKGFTAENTGTYARKKRFIDNITRKNQHVANTITTKAGSRPIDNFILEPANNEHENRGVITLYGEPYNLRKLTPRETWRLMGISDNDFDKAQTSGISDAQLYKQAGNAIVVNALYYIFKNLFLG